MPRPPKIRLENELSQSAEIVLAADAKIKEVKQYARELKVLPKASRARWRLMPEHLRPTDPRHDYITCYTELTPSELRQRWKGLGDYTLQEMVALVNDPKIKEERRQHQYQALVQSDAPPIWDAQYRIKSAVEAIYSLDEEIRRIDQQLRDGIGTRINLVGDQVQCVLSDAARARLNEVRVRLLEAKLRWHQQLDVWQGKAPPESTITDDVVDLAQQRHERWKQSLTQNVNYNLTVINQTVQNGSNTPTNGADPPTTRIIDGSPTPSLPPTATPPSQSRELLPGRP